MAGSAALSASGHRDEREQGWRRLVLTSAAFALLLLLCCVPGLRGLGGGGQNISGVELAAVSGRELRRALNAELQPRFRAENRELSAVLGGAGIPQATESSGSSSVEGLSQHSALARLAQRYGKTDTDFGGVGLGLKGDPTSALLSAGAKELRVEGTRSQGGGLFSMLLGQAEQTKAPRVPWSDTISWVAEKDSEAGVSPNHPRASSLPWGSVAERQRAKVLRPQFLSSQSTGSQGTGAADVVRTEKARDERGTEFGGSGSEKAEEPYGHSERVGESGRRAVGKPRLSPFQEGEETALLHEHNGFVRSKGFGGQDQLRDPKAFIHGEHQALAYEHNGFVKAKGFGGQDRLRDAKAFVKGEQKALAYEHNGFVKAKGFDGQDRLRDPMAFVKGEQQTLIYEHNGFVRSKGFRGQQGAKEAKQDGSISLAFSQGEHQGLAFEHNGFVRSKGFRNTEGKQALLSGGQPASGAKDDKGTEGAKRAKARVGQLYGIGGIGPGMLARDPSLQTLLSRP